MIRAFVAVDVPLLPPLQPVMQSLSRMGRAVRPVGTDTLHITLKFFGDITEQHAVGIRKALEERLAGTAKFDLEMLGLGAFPHVDRPSVVWVGCGSATSLHDVAARVENAADELGHPREQRPFHPHATLARVKARPPGELRELIGTHQAKSFGRADIGAVRLYRSDLTPEGPRYRVLAEIPLE